MIIRNYLPGDTAKEAAIYNVAAARLPGFKPVVSEELSLSLKTHSFDPGTRFYAEESGRVVAYSAFDLTGRVHSPWCLQGHEKMAHPLMSSVFRALGERRISRAYAACRTDWAQQVDFFEDHGFSKAREIVNFTQSIGDLPTMFQRPGLDVSMLEEADIRLIQAMVPNLLRLQGSELVEHWIHRSNLPLDALFVLRRKDGSPRGLGILIDDPAFANVETLDTNSPTYWFGSLGSEGLAAKKVNGLFSFATASSKDAMLIGQDLLWYGTSRRETNSFEDLAAQVPSDVPHLLEFYQRYFQKRGSFAVYEREVGTGSRF